MLCLEIGESRIDQSPEPCGKLERINGNQGVVNGLDEFAGIDLFRDLLIVHSDDFPKEVIAGGNVRFGNTIACGVSQVKPKWNVVRFWMVSKNGEDTSPWVPVATESDALKGRLPMLCLGRPFRASNWWVNRQPRAALPLVACPGLA